ncbi:MAG: hypothetical protein HUU46_14590 [Candidatus Hydrogenedentes bacterium]|nr:hypothetical protein [Candidatus Hydrogenedentota bacterium]
MTPEKALGFMAALLGLLAVKAGCVAMSVWLDKSAPAFTARALNVYQTRGKRSFVLGVVNGLLLFFLFTALTNAQLKPLGVLGIVILLATAAAALTGYMIAYNDIGQRLRGERNWSATQTIIYGGITMEAAFMAPVIGQVFSIGVLFRGFGAVVSALLSRGKV